MNDDFERMVWTRYKNEKGFVTSIKLSKADCEFIKEKFGNRTQWIQQQHEQPIGQPESHATPRHRRSLGLRLFDL